jgi:chromate transporter
MADPILTLLPSLMLLSLVSVGGMLVVLADLHRLVVVEGGWMDDGAFTTLFALAQAAPGPNMLFVSLLGWRLGGVSGAAAATLAFVMPTTLLTALAARSWARWGERRWFVVLRRGLVPVTLGLLVASSLLLIGSTGDSTMRLVLIAGAAVLTFATRLPPVAILALAAAAGALGLA